VLVARHYMDGFVDRLTSAVKISEAFYASVTANRRIRVARVPDGTNIARVTIADADPEVVVRRLAERGIRMPAAGPGGVFTLAVNETWNRTTSVELVKAFDQVLS
jgi:threonine aldolase